MVSIIVFLTIILCSVAFLVGISQDGLTLALRGGALRLQTAAPGPRKALQGRTKFQF